MATHYRPKIVTDGLVLYLDAANPKSYLSGSTTWSDLSGKGNNGTLVNDPTFNSENGGSIVFDDVNDRVDIYANSSLNITTAISIEVIFKTANNDAIQRLITKADTSEGTFGKGFQMAKYTTGRMLVIYNNVNSRIYLYSNSLSTSLYSNFTHVVYIYNGTNSQKIYINGNNESGVGQFSNDFVAGDTLNTNLLLMRGQSSTDYALGNLAIVKLYNRALTPQEILQNYNATKGRFNL